MFTGIVQTVGIVRALQPQSTGARLVVDAPELQRPIADGASIAVNGACLTVTASNASQITFDVVHETLKRTTLGKLRPGDRANLEPSLRASDRLDGHIVQGHIDGTAQLIDIQQAGGEQRWRFCPEAQLIPYIIPKGSIAIEGVSLTIAEVEADTFTVALIPTTLAETTLGSHAVGDTVNIETDILVRTIVTTLNRLQGGDDKAAPSLTIDMLREQGW